MKTDKKQIVKLTESQLKCMIAESVKKALNEYDKGLDNPNIDQEFGPKNYNPRTKKAQNNYSWDVFDEYKSAQMDPSELEDMQNMYSYYDGLKSYEDIADEYGLENHDSISKHSKFKFENKEMKNITESQLRDMIAESVKKVLNEAKKAPKDQYFGGYFFEGIGWNINGNPIYYSNNLPLEAKKMLGWRKSKKWGICGQADNWRVRNVLEKLGLPFGNEEDEYYNTL